MRSSLSLKTQSRLLWWAALGVLVLAVVVPQSDPLRTFGLGSAALGLVLSLLMRIVARSDDASEPKYTVDGYIRYARDTSGRKPTREQAERELRAVGWEGP